MLRTDADVALLTDSRYTASSADPADWYLANILREDELLAKALGELGLTTRRVDWADPAVDWSRFQVALFRTTWDYFDRPAEFAHFIERVAGQTRLCNRRELVEWNRDKHYLHLLESQGLPVVPSRYIERGARLELGEVFRETGWPELVVKPCVSGAARHTYRITPGTAPTHQSLLNQLLEAEALICQPFQTNILTNGEDTLVLLGGRFSHAVKKRPQPGDFRVQDDHGGTVEGWQPAEGQIELAERAMAACPFPPVYGRVDLVRDNQGGWAIMELELIEPELWLRNHPPAAQQLAQAVVAWLAQ
ncbi:MAG: RimK family alpha-L-glutamate ligase [Planctomycetaceae bacterium]